MKKKVLALLLAVLLVAAALPMAAFADEGTVNWALLGDTVTVYGFAPMPDYTPDNLPHTWAGFTQGKNAPASIIEVAPGVTHIGNYAFCYMGCLSMKIADTVTSIGDHACEYSGCGDGMNVQPMDSLSIPGSVRTIGENAFYWFGTRSIVLHEGTEEVGNSALSTYALESIYLPSSLTKIGTNVLGECSQLKDIYYAGSEADFKAKGLTQLGYGSSVTIHYNSPAPGSSTPSTPSSGFTDVPDGEYYAAAVKWAVEKKITQGMTDTTFAPNDPCTRGQIVTFLWRANGSPEPASTVNPFRDVKAGDYYYKAVLWAKEKGITSGTDDTHFSPNDPCSRAQAVTFLWRANNKPTGSGSSFTDVPSGEYYTEAVNWAVQNGITTGDTSTTFAPGNICTRGQIVTFLYRAA